MTYLSFSTCGIINKAFLFLSWGGKAGVSISFIGKWEWKGNKGGKWKGNGIREKKGNKRENEREKEIREGNERGKGKLSDCSPFNNIQF